MVYSTVLYTVEVVYSAAEVIEAVAVAVAATEDSDSSTGQTVVYIEMMSVVTEPILAGQSVTVAAQEVIV